MRVAECVKHFVSAAAALASLEGFCEPTALAAGFEVWCVHGPDLYQSELSWKLLSDCRIIGGEQLLLRSPAARRVLN
jgi:hypothetical protein